MAKKNTEIARIETPVSSVVQTPSVLEIINRIADNPNTAVETMRGLFDLQKDFEARAAEKQFNIALSRLQPRLPMIEKRSGVDYANKSGGRTQFAYASYEDIHAKVNPLLGEEGFSVSFNQSIVAGNKTEYSIKLSHVAGHSESRTMILPDDTSGGKNSIQAVGSTVSYARRYLLMMILNIVTIGEDTDGVQFITPEQVHVLEQRCGQVGGNREKFLQYLGVESFEELPAEKYDMAIQRLFDKAAQKKQAEK